MISRKIFYACLALGFLAVPVMAQERTAGNATDLQMTWSTLKSMVDSAKARIELVNGRVDQVVACGDKGLNYGPNSPNKVSGGCNEAATTTGVALTTIANNLTSVTNNVSTNTNDIKRMIICSNAGKMYSPTAAGHDANGCTTTISSALVTRVVASSSPIKGNGKYASYALASCPAGTTLIACMGARNPSITDTCDEGSCGLVGSGPINDTTCMTTVDDDAGTRATVWATCLKTQ